MDGLTGEEQQDTFDHGFVHDQEEAEQRLKELYDVVSGKIRLIIADGRLTPATVRPLLLIVTETVQDFSDGLEVKLEGSEKRALAINVTNHVLADLHSNGQLDDETYEWIQLGMTFFGPALFDGLKSLYRQIHAVASDVAEHGCTGCFKRNFFSKRK